MTIYKGAYLKLRMVGGQFEDGNLVDSCIRLILGHSKSSLSYNPNLR